MYRQRYDGLHEHTYAVRSHACLEYLLARDEIVLAAMYSEHTFLNSELKREKERGLL